MARYIPLNQGDERIYLLNYTVIFYTGDDPISASTFWKQVVNGTEEVNGVETIKVESGLLGSPQVNFVCLVMDSESAKRYRVFDSGVRFLIHHG